MPCSSYTGFGDGDLIRDESSSLLLLLDELLGLVNDASALSSSASSNRPELSSQERPSAERDVSVDLYFSISVEMLVSSAMVMAVAVDDNVPLMQLQLSMEVVSESLRSSRSRRRTGSACNGAKLKSRWI